MRIARTYLPWLNLLLDAKWYTREEVLAVLRHKEGTNFTRSDDKQLAKSLEESVTVDVSGGDPLGGDAAVHDGPSRVAPAPVASEVNGPPPFRIPPRTAIAGVLISDWAFGKAPIYKGRI